MQKAILMAAVLAASGPALATDSGWDVRRSSTSGSCSLQPSGSLPSLGVLLTSKPTKKEACEAAAALKTDDAADGAKCFDYTPNTVRLCKNEGVNLPQ